MKRNSLNFLCFIPTFKTMYRVTGTAPDIGVRQKPTYHSSGRSFSGSGFSGSSGSSKRNRKLPAYRRDPIFLSFLYNQSTTNDANYTKEEDANNSNLSFWRWNRLNLSFYTYLPFKKYILLQQ